MAKGILKISLAVKVHICITRIHHQCNFFKLLDKINITILAHSPPLHKPLYLHSGQLVNDIECVVMCLLTFKNYTQDIMWSVEWLL